MNGAGRKPCARPGIEVLIVDPKRIRHFAKAAGRLAKNDPIDAETIARFAEAFPDGGAEPHDPAREEIDRLVQARTALKDVEDRIKHQGEHRPPAIVAKALAAVAKAMRAELRKLDAAIAAKIKANPCSRVGPSSSTACPGSPIRRSPA